MALQGKLRTNPSTSSGQALRRSAERYINKGGNPGIQYLDQSSNQSPMAGILLSSIIAASDRVRANTSASTIWTGGTRRFPYRAEFPSARRSAAAPRVDPNTLTTTLSVRR